MASVLGGFIQYSNPILASFRNGFLRLLNVLPSKPIDALIEKYLYGLEVKNFSKLKHPLVGKRIPQPLVILKNQRKVYLDELCGFHWVVLFRSDCKIIPFNPSGFLKYISLVEDFSDSSIEIKSVFFNKWMIKNKVDFVVIRPDKFIFDIGKVKDYDEIIRNIDSYINKISSN